MFAFSDFNCRIDSSNKLNQVENKNENHVAEITVAKGFVGENDGDAPPKTKAVEGQKNKL